MMPFTLPPDLKRHAFNLFPEITGQDFEELADDIRTRGVLEPITLFEGTILDGWNRYRAAKTVDADCPAQQYRGDDPLGHSVSLNLKRRHLSTGQRAVIAARLANMGRGERTDRRLQANLPEVHVSRERAATALNVSVRTIGTARKVLAVADREIIKAVEDGTITLAAAALTVSPVNSAKSGIVSPNYTQSTPRKPIIANIVRTDPATATAMTIVNSIFELYRGCIDLTPEQFLSRLSPAHARKMKIAMKTIRAWMEKADPGS